jgi:exopolysaccharide production protein ExoZ
LASILSIQYLRAIAALMVVASHALQRPDNSFQIGAAGVDLFFVISGFIMWVVARDAAPDGRSFLLHRAIRIVPTYWAVTLGLVGLATLWPGLMPNFETDPARVLMSLAFIPHFNARGEIYPVLAVGWTLVFEMLFYLLFAASYRLRHGHRLWAMAAVLGGLVLAGLLLRPAGAVALTLTNPIILEFLAGMLIGEAWLRRRLPEPPAALALVALGLLALLAQFLAGLGDALPRLPAWGGPAACIVLGCVAMEARRGVPHLATARAVGDASYSIYLLHGPMVGPVLRLAAGWPPMAGLALLLAGSVLAGLLCFRWFERPVTRLLRDAARQASGRAARLGSSRA